MRETGSDEISSKTSRRRAAQVSSKLPNTSRIERAPYGHSAGARPAPNTAGRQIRRVSQGFAHGSALPLHNLREDIGPGRTKKNEKTSS